MELCTRNLFLLDKLRINNFICSCWKYYAIVYGKNDQKYGAAVIGSFTTTVPLSTRPWVCSSLWQTTTWRLPLILPIHRTLRHATFSCSLVWKAGWTGNVLLMFAKWKRKRWGSWRHQYWRVPEMFSAVGKMLVQVYRAKTGVLWRRLEL